MAKHLRQTLIAATAVIGLSGFAAIAAPPASGDPTVVPRAKTSGGHDRTASIDQRIAALHAELQITPAQQPQWDQFAQVMRDNAHDMDDTFKTRIKALPSMTAAENMQSYAQVAAAHAQEVQKLVPVFQALYDTMPDSQKRMADQVFRNDSHPRHRAHDGHAQGRHTPSGRNNNVGGPTGHAANG